jgi:GT2 family glycosyltransferase
VALLRKCIESILPGIDLSPAQILIIDNDSNDPETLDYLADAPSQGIDVLTVPGPFNFSRLNNIAAAHSVSERLCLLNNDVQAIDDDWLAEISSRLEDPTVGAVGALLVWSSMAALPWVRISPQLTASTSVSMAIPVMGTCCALPTNVRR